MQDRLHDRRLLHRWLEHWHLLRYLRLRQWRLQHRLCDRRLLHRWLEHRYLLRHLRLRQWRRDDRIDHRGLLRLRYGNRDLLRHLRLEQWRRDNRIHHRGLLRLRNLRLGQWRLLLEQRRFLGPHWRLHVCSARQSEGRRRFGNQCCVRRMGRRLHNRHGVAAVWRPFRNIGSCRNSDLGWRLRRRYRLRR